MKTKKTCARCVSAYATVLSAAACAAEAEHATEVANAKLLDGASATALILRHESSET